MGRPRGSKNKPKTESAPAAESAPAEDNAGKALAEDNAGEPAQDEAPVGSAAPAYRERLALMNEVIQTHRELDAAAKTEAGEDAAPPAETAPAEPPSGQEKPGEETPQEPPPPESPPAAEPAKRKLTIDGVERELTETELIALAQKHGSADVRLAEATRILEDAKRQAATLMGAQPAAATLAGATPAAQPPGSTGVEKALIEEISEALLYGDKEQIAKGFEKLLGAGRPSAIPSATDPRDIQRYVIETIEFERAKAALGTSPEQGGFSDVWDDPMLRRMFEKRETELREGDPSKGVAPDNRPYRDLYAFIAGELRQWRDEFLKKHHPPTGLENRDNLKRSTGIVRGGGGKIPVTAATPPKTHEDILAEMRRSRGLN